MTKIDKQYLTKKAEELGFVSKFFNSKPYKYSLEKENLRWHLWLNEFSKWLADNHQIFVNIGVDCTTAPKFYYKISAFTGNPLDLGSSEWHWNNYQSEYLYRTNDEALYEGFLYLFNLIDDKSLDFYL